MTSPRRDAPAGSRPSNLALYYDNAAILREGNYIHPETDTIVDLSGAVAASCAGVVAYDTAATERALWERSFPRPSRFPPIQTTVSVTEEKSTGAAARLTANGAPGPIAVLNYANAEEPGGGYTRGARAQEEDLCRTSALYTTLVTPAAQPFYAAHTARHAGRRDHYFSHSAIYSPAVPVFRDDDYKLLDPPYAVDFITAAAPYSSGHSDPKARLARLFDERAARVLAIAAKHGARTLVLGAWGCGAFGNDPNIVAPVFARLFAKGGEFHGVFEHVVFAVYDPGDDKPNYRAFKRVFPEAR